MRKRGVALERVLEHQAGSREGAEHQQRGGTERKCGPPCWPAATRGLWACQSDPGRRRAQPTVAVRIVKLQRHARTAAPARRGRAKLPRQGESSRVRRDESPRAVRPPTTVGRFVVFPWFVTPERVVRVARFQYSPGLLFLMPAWRAGESVVLRGENSGAVRQGVWGRSSPLIAA